MVLTLVKKIEKKRAKNMKANNSDHAFVRFLVMYIPISFIIFLLVFMFRGLGQGLDTGIHTKNVQEAHYSNVEKKLNVDYKTTLKQKYVTVKQLKSLVNRANTFGDGNIPDKYLTNRYVNKFYNRFNNSRVVDNTDGHVYLADAKINRHGVFGQYRTMSFSLTPVNNGNASEIDSNWKKEHKK